MRKAAIALLAAVALVTLWVTVAAATGPTGDTEDPLARLGLRAFEGATPGYIADVGCRTCHASIYESYQRVGMAQALRSPAEVADIEDFDVGFFHEPTQRHYRIRREGERLVFRRHQLDDDGQPINVFERDIDWVLGSGNRARSYLFQTENGELFQLPLGWYSESGSWGMSPGFEFREQMGVQRQVKRECMFCHNAYPEVAQGSDAAAEPHVFPHDLPQGTGCQRCHGPGAEHVRAALDVADLEGIRRSIVNPARLPAEERDSVCFQCHMLPAVSIVGLRRFDRADYSFRPGERLSEFLVHVEVEQEGVEREDLFEINHHGYRFWQSRCFQESGGELGCISCHDPHVKPESAVFRAEVAGRCRSCHEGWADRHEAELEVGVDGCVGCHMPTRRTRDVVLVTMTDHRIARGPFDREELIKPIVKTEPILTDINLLPYGETPEEVEREIYRVAPVVKTYSDPGAIRKLETLLDGSRIESHAPHVELLKGQLKAGNFQAAEHEARRLLARDPEMSLVRGLLGISQVGQGKTSEALESLERALAERPTPEAHYNYALAALQGEQLARAAEHFEAAVALRPTLFRAWVYLGRVEAMRGDLEAARNALTRSLEVEPSYGPAYGELIEVLRGLGEATEAERYLAVGLRVSRDPSRLEPLVED